jgi:hypothetical protein
MFTTLNPSDYPPELIVGAAVAIVIGGAAIGYITDIVMGDRGFGPFGNGVLAVLGAGLGVYAQVLYSGELTAGGLMITASAAAAAATAILLILGVIKSLVQG